MTLYLLNGGEQVNLPVRPLVVRLQPGPGAEACRLSVPQTGGANLVVIERQGMLVLPRLTRAATITVVPRSGLDRFPAQSVLTLVVGPDGNDPDADYVQVGVDVSGLAMTELVTLVPGDHAIAVSALGRRSDPELPPHAELARNLARELLGVAYVRPEQAMDLVVGIDCSPSMRGYLADDVLQDTLDLFAGIASVLDPDGAIDPVLCGRSVRHLDPAPLDTFAATTVAEVAQQPLVTGLRSQALTRSAAGTLTYLITDGVPADVVRHLDEPGAVHLALLGASTGPGAGSPPMRAAPSESQASTAVDAGRGGSADGLRWDRRQARTIVKSLLTPYTTLQETTS